jgi:hypothetical protein
MGEAFRSTIPPDANSEGTNPLDHRLRLAKTAVTQVVADALSGSLPPAPTAEIAQKNKKAPQPN